jgi:hypothetical protein
MQVSCTSSRIEENGCFSRAYRIALLITVAAGPSAVSRWVEGSVVEGDSWWLWSNRSHWGRAQQQVRCLWLWPRVASSREMSRLIAGPLTCTLRPNVIFHFFVTNFAFSLFTNKLKENFSVIIIGNVFSMDAVVVQVLDRTDPLMLNLKGTHRIHVLRWTSSGNLLEEPVLLNYSLNTSVSILIPFYCSATRSIESGGING